MSLMLTACVAPSIVGTPTAVPTQSPEPSQTPAAEDLALKIDQLLTLHTEKESFVGAVLVSQNGEILFSQGYGWADRENQIPNTSKTKFRLGSVLTEVQVQDSFELLDGLG